MRCATRSTITFGIGSFLPIKLYRKQPGRRSRTEIPSSHMHGWCISASQPWCIYLPLLTGRRWSRKYYCTPGNLASDFPSLSSIQDLCWKVSSLYLPSLERPFTCAACPRQGVTAISYGRIDPMYLYSLTIPPIRLAAHDDLVCRFALSPCERRRCLASWNGDGCYDGQVKEYSRCGVL